MKGARVMGRKRDGLLAQIETGVLDETVPLSSLLQKCIVLGGQAGSENMRDWARRELNGYGGEETVPNYRHIAAPMMALITNSAGYNGLAQRIHDHVFPEQIREFFQEKGFDLEDAVLGGGIGELEALARRDADVHKLSPQWSTFVLEALNRFNMRPGSVVAAVYWEVSDASIKGLLVRVRTALAELVAELVSLMPEDQAVPDKRAADAAVHLVITGDRNTINYISQESASDGANTVTVAGSDATAIGSQTASGANSSAVGSQAVRGDCSVVAGRDAPNGDRAEPPEKDGWWARLRKRGALVAIFTVIAGVVAVFTWIGWIPWT